MRKRPSSVIMHGHLLFDAFGGFDAADHGKEARSHDQVVQFGEPREEALGGGVDIFHQQRVAFDEGVVRSRGALGESLNESLGRGATPSTYEDLAVALRVVR